MSNAGRKAKYPTKLLEDKLIEYTTENPNTKIKFSNLEKYTGIPYHVWRDNKDINDAINKINNPQLVVDTTNMKLELPSADDILEKNYPNKDKLLQAISDLLNLTSSLYEKAIIGEHFEQIKNKYEIEIKEIIAKYEKKLKEANNQIDNLTKEIDTLYLDSRNSLTRKQKGLKDNMIELSKKRKKAVSKDLKDIEEEFDGLFN